MFADVAQPDQARIVGLNAQFFLKNGGFYIISIKASCIDSTAPPEAVFAREIKKLTELDLRPKEQVHPCSLVAYVRIAVSDTRFVLTQTCKTAL